MNKYFIQKINTYFTSKINTYQKLQLYTHVYETIIFQIKTLYI